MAITGYVCGKCRQKFADPDECMVHFITCVGKEKDADTGELQGLAEAADPGDVAG